MKLHLPGNSRKTVRISTTNFERSAEDVVKESIKRTNLGRFEELPKWAQDELLRMQNLIWRLIRLLTKG